MNRLAKLTLGLAAALGLVAGAHAHDERHPHAGSSLRGGTCTSPDGARFRILEAVALRRSIRRDLARLPLRRERLGSMDTLVVIQRIEDSAPIVVLPEAPDAELPPGTP